MKQTRKLVGFLVAGAVALAMVSNLNAQTPKERTAKVVRVKGGARYSTGNNIWQPLEVGTLLKAGVILQTAADSFVDIVLGDSGSAASPGMMSSGHSPGSVSSSYRTAAEQDVVRVFADSVLAIDKLNTTDTGIEPVTETALDLRSGKIFGTVKKLSAGSHYEVKIPNGVAGIRGTSYTISADGVVTVYEGSVVIAYTGPDGKPMTQVVMAGFQFDPRTGQITAIPPGSEPPTIPQSALTTATTYVVDHTLYFVSPTQEEADVEGATLTAVGGP
jgi:hypothetical protein